MANKNGHGNLVKRKTLRYIKQVEVHKPISGTTGEDSSWTIAGDRSSTYDLRGSFDYGTRGGFGVPTPTRGSVSMGPGTPGSFGGGAASPGAVLGSPPPKLNKAKHDENGDDGAGSYVQRQFIYVGDKARDE